MGHTVIKPSLAMDTLDLVDKLYARISELERKNSDIFAESQIMAERFVNKCSEVSELERKLKVAREFIEMATDNVGHHVCDAARKALEEIK